jgi:MFS family permease
MRRTFRAFEVRNYRLFFLGQSVSNSGSWMQQIAMAWLVLDVTGSAFALGATIALQALPYLLFGVWGGLLADRAPKRRLLICTQLAHTVVPFLLWVLVESGRVEMWMVYLLFFARGVVNSVDNPARQSFVPEMVGRDRIVSAVSLNASIVQASRLVGPAVAAVVIATLGLAPCFLVNGLTFLFMVAMLLLMRPGELTPAAVAPRGKGQVRQALAVAARTPDLRMPLLTMTVVGLFSFNFTVVLPAVARFTFHGTPTTYALMMGFLATGALGGALLSGTRATVSGRAVAWASIAFGAALGVAAVLNQLSLVLIALIVVGATSVTFSASVQSVLQLTAQPAMRGRILSLYQIVYTGTTPLGALLVGSLAATVGARSGLVVGSVAALVAGGLGVWSRRRGLAGGVLDRRERPAGVVGDSP